MDQTSVALRSTENKLRCGNNITMKVKYYGTKTSISSFMEDNNNSYLRRSTD